MPTRKQQQLGFGTVELVVSLVVVAILMALVVPSFLGSRSTARLKAVQAAANSYKEAIAGFQLDHGNRAPQIPADWPQARLAEGPLQTRIAQGVPRKPYMRSGTPEVVASGAAVVLAAPPGPSAAGANGAIVYRPGGNGSAQWRLDVYYRDTLSDPWPQAPACQLSNTGIAETC